MSNEGKMNVFETSNRKLEQFLFAHFIRHESWYKSDDEMTVWVYQDTPELRAVVAEYKELVSKNRSAR